MLTSIEPVQASPARSLAPPSAPAAAQVPAAVQAHQAVQAGETRLVIEQDEQSGDFVYKTVDPLSREVLSQYPTKELLELKGRPAYQPGAVVQHKI